MTSPRPHLASGGTQAPRPTGHSIDETVDSVMGVIDSALYDVLGQGGAEIGAPIAQMALRIVGHMLVDGWTPPNRSSSGQ